MASQNLYQTTVTFERHDETTIRKMITQRNMVQTTITRYYRPVNERADDINEAKKMPSPDKNEGIHFFCIVLCIDISIMILTLLLYSY